MKRHILFLIALFIVITAGAQKITHDFRNVSMSKALKEIEASTNKYSINFIYNELEDFTVTTSVKNKNVTDAIRQIMGFYPIKMTVDGTNIFVECVQKQAHKFIGKIVDDKGIPVEFANILLMQPTDSAYITGGVSNEAGQFVIPCEQQRVIARISCVGCKTVYTIFDNSNIGNIRLHSQVTRIKAVTVTSLRPTIINHGDRLVVDVSHSSMAFGNTAQTLLLQLPGVWSNGGNITINGISGAKVMIDNREIKLDGDALAQYLSTIKSEIIDKIEVIAHPGAEFSAEGASGVIRIIMHERSVGQELTLGGTLDVINYKATEPYARYAFSNRKFGFDVTYGGTFTYGNDNYMKTDEYTENLKKLINYDDKDIDYMKDHIYNLNANIYYDFSKRSKLAFNTSLYQWAKDENSGGNTLINGVGADEIKKTQTTHLESQMMHSFTSSLNYSYSFDEKERNKLLIVADFARQYHYSIDDDYTYMNYGISDNLISKENERNNQNDPYTIVSAEVRYTADLGTKGIITSGMKGSHSAVENNMEVSELANNAWTIQPNMGYNFKYDENLQAAYVKYNLNKESWNLTAGLREEYVHANTNANDSKYHHLDLFPSIYLSHSLSDKQELTVSYARRTNRIRYFSLLPYRYYSSRYTIMEGNPALKPDYGNTIGLTYSLLKKYYFTATYYWSNNGTSRYNKNEIINDKTIIVTTTIDGVKQRLWNFNVYVPVTVSKRWSIVNEVSTNYNIYHTNEVDNYNFCWDAYTRHTIILPAALKLELLYKYSSSQHTAYAKYSEYHTLNASLMKRFLNNQLMAKLNVNDIICHQKNKSIVSTADIVQHSYMYGKYVPYVSITINYTFSKGRKRNFQNIEHSNNQDRNRKN
jgi:hypothetical protein